MDPLGATTTLVQYAQKLKDLFDQASDNEAQFRVIASDIVDELEKFQNTVKQNLDGLDGKWQKSLLELQGEMDLAYSRWARTFNVKHNSRISAMKSRFTRIKNADQHRQEIERLQTKIRDMKTRFLIDATIRQEIKMAETHQLVANAQDMGREAHIILQSIERRMEIFVAQSETDPAMARDLIGVTSLTTQQMETGRANASQMLQSSHSSPLEKRYTTIKRRTLEAALESVSGTGAVTSASIAPPVILPSTQRASLFPDNSPKSLVYTTEPEPLTFQPPDMDGMDAFQETLRAVKIQDGDGADVKDVASANQGPTQPSRLNSSSDDHNVAAPTPTESAITPEESQQLTDLARSITNVAYQLSTASQNEEALQLYREAANIRRRLAAQGDEVHLFELSQSLHNLAHHLRIIGRSKEGLSLDSEVVVIRRGLVTRNSDVYLPSLAAGLHMLGHVYSCVLREQEALPFFEEVVKIYRRLAAENSGSYQGDLAQALHNLAHHLRKLGRNEEGLKLDMESLTLRQRLYIGS